MDAIVTRRATLYSVAVFFITAVALWFLGADRFVMMNDEGIYIDGARRVANGLAPYRDFWILSGPGTFWMHGLSFKLFGISMWAAHIPVILDVAAIAACVFLLTTRFTQPILGFATTLFYLVFTLSDPTALTANHRWDSAALALLAITLIATRTTHWHALAAGACAAGAIWVTPSMIGVAVSIGVYLLIRRESRESCWWYIAGGVLVASGGLAWLGRQGAVEPMFRHFSWAAKNYGGANTFVFGGIIGGYGALFKDASGFDLVVRALLVFFIALPAVAPILSFTGWLTYRLIRKRTLPAGLDLLLAVGPFYLFSAYPRMDVSHIMYVAALFYILLAVLLDRVIRGVGRPLTLSFVSIFAILFGWSLALHLSKEGRIDTPIGSVRASQEDLALLSAVLTHVKPGDSLFIFPYPPIMYFFTQASNPTSFSFLHPGMTTADQEQLALRQLAAKPPRFLFYSDVPPAAFLRIWPSSDPARLRMWPTENFIKSNYKLLVKHKHPSLAFHIMERSPSPIAAGSPRPQ